MTLFKVSRVRVNTPNVDKTMELLKAVEENLFFARAEWPVRLAVLDAPQHVDFVSAKWMQLMYSSPNMHNWPKPKRSIVFKDVGK